MTTLKSILEKDYSKKTKAELVQILKGVEQTIGTTTYQTISGIEPDEMTDLSKKDVFDILNSFKIKYDTSWEKAMETSSKTAINLLTGLQASDNLKFDVADAATANFATELGSIDFAKIIGGPLDACVRAQATASISTVNFINNVGFETDAGGNKTLRMAEFKYKKNAPNPNFDNTKPVSPANPLTTLQDVNITVPFIALLNIPSIRIESCDIDFNVKLNSTFTETTKTDFNFVSGASGGTGGLASLFAKASFKVEISVKRSTTTGIRVEKEYSLGVKVRATNDEMPAGLEKVLGLLAN
ncbi:MAG: DUF2589 domain-containing protein [Bacteroidetes bacterium]|jgi:hypothetical protein|nr:DUF2589 domain-containing protein [Bacteroidota bacterium]